MIEINETMSDDALNTMLILLGSGIVCLLISLILKSGKKEIKELETAPNGEGKDLSLMRINGFGNAFSGKFGEALIDGKPTFRTYQALHILFVPLLPYSAYRVRKEKGEKEYMVYGSEKMRANEAFSVVFRGVGIALVVMAIAWVIASIV